MKRKRFGSSGAPVLVLALALGLVLGGCSSAPKLDAIGPNQSALIVKAPLSGGQFAMGIGLKSWVVLADEGAYQSGALTNAVVSGPAARTSVQLNIPNGKHTVEVRATSGVNNPAPYPIEIDVRDVVVTYRLREVTDAEKTARGIGTGSTAFTLALESEEHLTR
jgi:hypothetical protein